MEESTSKYIAIRLLGQVVISRHGYATVRTSRFLSLRYTRFLKHRRNRKLYINIIFILNFYIINHCRTQREGLDRVNPPH